MTDVTMLTVSRSRMPRLGHGSGVDKTERCRYLPVTSKEGIQWLVRWTITLCFACVGACITAHSVSLYGPGLSPDSVGYITLADDISERGLSFLKEDRAVVQPPLYPVILSALSRCTRTTSIGAAALVNISCAAALMALILLAVQKVTGSLLALIAAGISSCFSVPLTAVWSMAWSEPLFILIVFLVLLVAGDGRYSSSSCLLAGFLTPAACLTRYVGVVMLPIMTSFILLTRTDDIRQRLKHAGIYVLPSTLLLALYVLRNIAVSGTLMGPRYPSQFGVLESVDWVQKVVLAWYLHWRIRVFETGLLAACVMAGAVAWHHRHAMVRAVRNWHRLLRLCVAFCVVYTGFIVWTSATTAYDCINDRILSPLYAPLTVVLMAALNPEQWRHRFLRLMPLAVFCLSFAVAPLRATCSQVRLNAVNGAGGFNTRQWKESGLIEYLRKCERRQGERIFSNTPEALWLWVDVNAKLSPARRHYNSRKLTGITPRTLFVAEPGLQGALFVWFRPNLRDYLFDDDDMAVMCDMVAVRKFPDGVIYRIRGPILTDPAHNGARLD